MIEVMVSVDESCWTLSMPEITVPQIRQLMDDLEICLAEAARSPSIRVPALCDVVHARHTAAVSR